MAGEEFSTSVEGIEVLLDKCTRGYGGIVGSGILNKRAIATAQAEGRMWLTVMGSALFTWKISPTRLF